MLPFGKHDVAWVQLPVDALLLPLLSEVLEVASLPPEAAEEEEETPAAAAAEAPSPLAAAAAAAEPAAAAAELPPLDADAAAAAPAYQNVRQYSAVMLLSIGSVYTRALVKHRDAVASHSLIHHSADYTPQLQQICSRLVQHGKSCRFVKRQHK